jgi:CheY-like chemotaxis protein
MPRMDGLRLLELLSIGPDTRNIPVAILTNYDDESRRRAAMALGAKEYILKTSVVPPDLPRIVERWLARPES